MCQAHAPAVRVLWEVCGVIDVNFAFMLSFMIRIAPAVRETKRLMGIPCPPEAYFLFEKSKVKSSNKLRKGKIGKGFVKGQAF